MSSKKTPTRPSSQAGNEGAAASAGKNVDECDLVIDVDLEGIRLPRLARLKTGDLLKVELKAEGPYPTVICVDAEGEIVGALSAFLNLVQLIRCLRAGVKYQVGVTQLRPGGCHVVGSRVA
ncbi:hypothetical protein [Methylosinus sp. LW3]|uniref:hypothetical protein n=1 Tax=Methylosinus sp. LW3 TaxID=107635 RepID=UPI00046606FF|nr:hypothetical protein [Methylosinus sp. LW3]